MATLSELDANEQINRIKVPLDPDEQPCRRIFSMPRVKYWLLNHIPTEADGFYPGAPTPKQQALDMLKGIIIGNTDFAKKPMLMEPGEDGIWELRTFDLRFFCWCHRRGSVVLSSINTKKNCKNFGLYHGYRTQAVTDRNTLPLDEPKFITGEWNECF